MEPSQEEEPYLKDLFRRFCCDRFSRGLDAQKLCQPPAELGRSQSVRAKGRSGERHALERGYPIAEVASQLAMMSFHNRAHARLPEANRIGLAAQAVEKLKCRGRPVAAACELVLVGVEPKSHRSTRSTPKRFVQMDDPRF
jgi:hypothetical protein